MLKVNLLEDEELREIVNAFISALLPHDNFESSMYSNVLTTLLKYIHLDEFKLEHGLVINALFELNRVKTAMPDFEPRLLRDTLESFLEASIMDSIARPELGVTEWLEFEGLNTNLNIQTVREDACQKICERTLDLYDECFAMGENTCTVLNREPALKAAFLANYSRQCINTQAEILRGEARVGRKRYRGSVDWLEYITRATVEVKERVNLAESSKVLKLDSVEGSYALLKELQALYVRIANYGIPELDDFTPILTHRLVVVVGRENIGKTKFAVDKAANVLLAGGKVAYMCGESHKAQVYADIMINYIYKKYGIFIRGEHLAAPEMCPDDVRKIIGMAINTVVEEKGLILCDSFSYDTVYSELEALYESTAFDMVVIDHSQALVGTASDGTLKGKIDALATAVRDFKKAYPVCVMVTSHPSTVAKDTSKRDKRANDSPTAGSSKLSAEADEVFLLRDNETLQKQGLLILENTKRRGASVVEENIILQKRFEVSALIYDPALQGGENQLALKREEALRAIDDICKVDEEDAFDIE